MSDHSAPPPVEIRSSACKVGYLRSMLAMRWYIDHGRDDSAAMSIGRLAHMAILQPDRKPPVWTGGRRAGAEWDAFCSDHAGEETYTQAENETAKAIAAAVYANPDAADLLSGTQRELPISWPDGHGGTCGTRIDAWKAGVLIDVKTAREIGRRDMGWTARRMGYDVQFGFMRWGLAALKIGPQAPACWIVAVENKPPYDCACYRIDPMQIAEGQAAAYETVERFRACERVGKYPGVSPGREMLTLPPRQTDESATPPAEVGAAEELG